MFSIVPNKATAKIARQAQANKVKKSIAYLMRECATKMKLIDEDIDFAIIKLDKINYLAPEIHHLHHTLQSAMRNQSIKETKFTLTKLVHSINDSKNREPWINVSSIGNLEWETSIANEAIRLTEKDCGKVAVINSISESELSESKDILNAALNLIARYDPEMFDEIYVQVAQIKLFNGKITMGLTDVRMLGAMFIRLPRIQLNPVFYFLEHIIHEASHIHLNCLMSIDPLILNHPDERFISPLRSDLRPMVGVYHATFVSTRIARSLKKLYLETNDLNLLHPLAETIDEVIRGIIEINEYANLTDNGKKMVDDMQNTMEDVICMKEWNDYDFTNPRTHRFGAGMTKVDAFKNYYHENYISKI
jgi:hypothetical protein